MWYDWVLIVPLIVRAVAATGLHLDGPRALDRGYMIHRNCVMCGTSRFTDREWNASIGDGGVTGSMGFRLGNSAVLCTACVNKRLQQAKSTDVFWSKHELEALESVTLPEDYAVGMAMRQLDALRSLNTKTFYFLRDAATFDVAPAKLNFSAMLDLWLTFDPKPNGGDGPSHAWRLERQSLGATGPRWWSQPSAGWISDQRLERAVSAACTHVPGGRLTWHVSYALDAPSREELAKYIDTVVHTRREIVRALRGNPRAFHVSDVMYDRSHGRILELDFCLSTNCDGSLHVPTL